MSDDHVGTDAVSKDVAQFFQILLQLYIMRATALRAKSVREAEARAKLAREHEKQAREAQLREARWKKALDPRNKELARACEKGRDEFFARNPHRDPWKAAERTAPAVTLEKPVREPMRWDSAERREHLREHLSRIVSPELAQVRMLHDLGCGTPGAASVDRAPEAGARRAAEARAREAREVRERAERNGHVREYS